MKRDMASVSDANVTGHATQPWVPGRPRRGKRQSAARLARQVARVVVLYVLIAGGSITFLFPFVWMLSTSLKVSTQVFVRPPIWIPNPVHWQNYVDAFTRVPTLTYLKNTLLIALLSTAGTVLSSSLVSYSFARLHWAGRDKWFGILLATMMLPGQATMIPVFVMFNKFGWINTFRPLIVPAFFGSAFYIFLLRQFMMTIPVELDEAAIMDGAGPLTIWARILTPLCMPSLAAVSIFSFVGNWNDFMGPLIYLRSLSKYTLPLGLLEFRSRWDTEWQQLLAYSTMVMLPCLIVFFLFQRYFIEGIVLTGLKG